MILTTPNHSFNPWFVSPSPEDEEKNRFKDPTKRTDRTFRHSDHKFEWTEIEFQDWCFNLSKKWDYDVEISGVGSLVNYYGGIEKVPEFAPHPELFSQGMKSVEENSIRVPNDPYKFFATQIAIFKQRHPIEPERSPRSTRITILPFFATSSSSSHSHSNLNSSSSIEKISSSKTHPHQLLATEIYRPVSYAGKPKPFSIIRQELENSTKKYFRCSKVSVRELWTRQDVRRVTGGYMWKIVESILEVDVEEKWSLEVHESGGARYACDLLLVIDKTFDEMSLKDDWNREEEEGHEMIEEDVVDEEELDVDVHEQVIHNWATEQNEGNLDCSSDVWE
jgi:hypothetical protein